MRFVSDLQATISYVQMANEINSSNRSPQFRMILNDIQRQLKWPSRVCILNCMGSGRCCVDDEKKTQHIKLVRDTMRRAIYLRNNEAFYIVFLLFCQEIFVFFSSDFIYLYSNVSASKPRRFTTLDSLFSPQFENLKKKNVVRCAKHSFVMDRRTQDWQIQISTVCEMQYERKKVSRCNYVLFVYCILMSDNIVRIAAAAAASSKKQQIVGILP